MTGGGEGLDGLNVDGISSFWDGPGDSLESRMGDVSVDGECRIELQNMTDQEPLACSFIH